MSEPTRVRETPRQVFEALLEGYLRRDHAHLIAEWLARFDAAEKDNLTARFVDMYANALKDMITAWVTDQANTATRVSTPPLGFPLPASKTGVVRPQAEPSLWAALPVEVSTVLWEIRSHFHLRDSHINHDGSVGTIRISPLEFLDALGDAYLLGRGVDVTTGKGWVCDEG